MAGKSSVRYRKVSTSLWADARFRRLTPLKPSGQALWLWLICGPKTYLIPGIILGSHAELAARLQWSTEDFSKAFREACREDLLEPSDTCDAAGLTWLRNGPKHNKPESPNVVRSWRLPWLDVPECALKHKIWRGLKAFCEGFGEGYARAFEESCQEPSSNQEQEQEQEQDQERDVSPLRADPSPAAVARSPRSKPVKVATSEGADVALYLLEAIRSHYPAFDKPTAAWPLQADVILRRGVTAARLKAAIDFAHRNDRDTFWRKNVLSVATLGEKLATLEIQMGERPATKGKGLSAGDLFSQVGLRVVGGEGLP